MSMEMGMTEDLRSFFVTFTPKARMASTIRGIFLYSFYNKQNGRQALKSREPGIWLNMRKDHRPGKCNLQFQDLDGCLDTGPGVRRSPGGPCLTGF